MAGRRVAFSAPPPSRAGTGQTRAGGGVPGLTGESGCGLSLRPAWLTALFLPQKPKASSMDSNTKLTRSLPCQVHVNQGENL